MIGRPVASLRVRRLAAAAGLSAACAALASPPLDPLPAPFYSFDRSSPQVVGGTLRARDVLEFDGAAAVTALPGDLLGLVSPLDDLDGLSSSHEDWPIAASFALLFSVSRGTIGVEPPDPALLAAGVPYNVLDQASRGHAAGDQFISLGTFVLGGPPPVRAGGNSTLTRNNFDEGGTDFGAAPPTSGSTPAPGASQDNVDAMEADLAADRGVLSQLYFSAANGSPSLAPLSNPWPPSGASIFFNPDPQFGAATQPYAIFNQLQLVQNDDIDALIVFDFNSNGVYDPGDAVLFSLTPSSPSRFEFPGASSAPAADVFIARPGHPTVAFIPSFALGMGQPPDNIDALDLTPCAFGFDCALTAGIRYQRGDMNCDGVVDFADIDPFVLALQGPDVYAAAQPWCFWNAADANCDFIVNFGDIDPFVACLSGSCPCQ